MHRFRTRRLRAGRPARLRTLEACPPSPSIVPWRPAPSRVPAFEFVLDWYAQHLPEFAVRTVDTDDDVFVLAACRNRGIGAAELDEVVVINDADTLPEPEALRAAVAAAAHERSRAPALHGVPLARRARATPQLRAGVAGRGLRRSTSCSAPAPACT